MSASLAGRLVLPAATPRAISVQLALVLCAALVLPAAAHAAGLPVRLLLPMHWPVLLAGLCYGWRSGLLVGLAAPGVSVLLSGHPSLAVLPAMTLELGAYGLLAGLGVERLRLRRPWAVLLGTVGGRLVFVLSVVVTGGFTGAFLPYLQAAMLPGLPALAAQVLLLPVVARWWVEGAGSGGARRTGP